MAICKVTLNDRTLIDLTGNTIDGDTVAAGDTAHLSDGTVVTGTMRTGDRSVENGILARTISGEYTNDRVTRVYGRRFEKATSLTSVSFPNVTSVGYYAFGLCTSLEQASFPNATTFSTGVFRKASALESANYPAATSVGEQCFTGSGIRSIYLPKITFDRISSVFQSCTRLTDVPATALPKATMVWANSEFNDCTALTSAVAPVSHSSVGFKGCTNIESIDILVYQGNNRGGSAFTAIQDQFQNCTKLKKLILRNEPTVVPCRYTSAFDGSPFVNGEGATLYVPYYLVNGYINGSNWSAILAHENNQVLPIEGSPYEHYYVDGTPIQPLFSWDYTDGLLSENGWTKTISGTASETMTSDGLALTSSGGTSAYVSLTNAAYKGDYLMMEAVLSFTGEGTGFNTRLCVSSSGNYIQIYNYGGKWRRLTSSNPANGAVLTDALPNTEYKIRLFHNAGYVAVVINNYYTWTSNGNVQGFYGKTGIWAQGQDGETTILKSLVVKKWYQ